MKTKLFLLLQIVAITIFLLFFSSLVSASHNDNNDLREIPLEDKPVFRRKLPPALPVDNPNARCLDKKKMIWSVKNEYIFLNNEPFIFKGYTLAGLETSDMIFSDFAMGPNNVNKRSVDDILDWLEEEQFNIIKIPLSISYLLRESGGYTFQDLDEVVLKAQNRGLMILFSIDNISPGMVKNSLWYNKYFSESSYLDGMTRVVERYSNEWNFMGIDLMDEPYGVAQWGPDIIDGEEKGGGKPKEEGEEEEEEEAKEGLRKKPKQSAQPMVTDLYMDALKDIEVEHESENETIVLNEGGQRNEKLIPLAVAQEDVSQEDEYYNIINFYERAMLFISEMVPNYRGLFLVQGTFWGEEFGPGTAEMTLQVQTGISEIDSRIVYSPQIYSPTLRNVDIYQNYLPKDGPNFNQKYGFITSIYKSPIFISKFVCGDVRVAADKNFLDFLETWIDNTCQPGIIYDSKGSSQAKNLQIVTVLKTMIPNPTKIDITTAGSVKQSQNVCVNEGVFKENTKCIANLPKTLPIMVRDRSIELPVKVLDIQGYIDELKLSEYPEDVASYEIPPRQDMSENIAQDDDTGIIDPPMDDTEQILTDDDLRLGPIDEDKVDDDLQDEDDDTAAAIDDDEINSDYLGDGLPVMAFVNVEMGSTYSFIFGVGPVRLIQISGYVQNTGNADACNIIINVSGLGAAIGNRLTTFRGVTPNGGDNVLLTQGKVAPGKLAGFQMTIPSGNFAPVYPDLSIKAAQC